MVVTSAVNLRTAHSCHTTYRTPSPCVLYDRPKSTLHPTYHVPSRRSLLLQIFALRGTRSSGRQFLSEPLGGRAGDPGRRVPHICRCVVNRYVPCLNESIPISIAFLCLENSSFLHYSHFLRGAIDGRLPPVLPLTHYDEIITST